MRRNCKFAVATALSLGLAAVPTLASTLTIGAISLDPSSDTAATFDITNLTGINSSPAGDPSAPVVTQLSFENIRLTIDFQSGGLVVENASQFLSDGAGGWLGMFDLDINGSPITSATLTGDVFPQSVMLNDGTSTLIAAMFSTTVEPSAGNTLQLGDASTIEITATPEPGYAGVLAAALGALSLAKRKRAVQHVA